MMPPGISRRPAFPGTVLTTSNDDDDLLLLSLSPKLLSLGVVEEAPTLEGRCTPGIISISVTSFRTDEATDSVLTTEPLVIEPPPSLCLSWLWRPLPVTTIRSGTLMAGLGREERPAAGTAELAAAEEDKEAAARIAARCSVRAVRTTTAATETLGLCLVAD